MKRSSLLFVAVATALWAGPARALPTDVVAGWDFSDFISNFFSVDGFTETGATVRPAQYTTLPAPKDNPRSGVFISNQFGTMYLDGQFQSTEVVVDFDLNGGITPLEVNLGAGRLVGVPLGIGEFDNGGSLAVDGQFETVPGALFVVGPPTIDIVFRGSVASDPLLLATEWTLNFGAIQLNQGKGNIDIEILVSGDGTNYTPVQTLEITELETEYTVPLGGLVDSDSEIFAMIRTVGSQAFEFGAGPLVDNVALLANVTVIPEPGTALLLATGLAGLVAAGRRRA